MDSDDAARIVEFLGHRGYDAMVYDGYSGRGMYGKKTDAIETDADITVVAWAIGYLQANGEIGDGESESESMPTIRYDSMGRDNIVVY